MFENDEFAEDENTSPSEDFQETSDGYIRTNKGVFPFELFNETPNTTKNFIDLVEEGFYDGLLFHRVLRNVLIQSGKESTRIETTSEVTNFRDDFYIKDEFVESFKHGIGSIAMAQSQNKGMSEFFITINARKGVQFDGGYPVFGKITDNLEGLFEIEEGDLIEEIKMNTISSLITNHKLKRHND